LKIVAIADLHIGSDVSVSQSGHGGKFPGLRNQLYKRYEQSAKGEFTEPDILFLLGDMIDGQNRKSSGIGTWTSDLQEQCDEACELISMWKPKKIYVARGSGYHVNVNNSGMQCEELIARALNAESANDGTKDRSQWYWYVTAKKKDSDFSRTFHVEHFIQGSKFFHYKAMPVAREMMQAKLTDRLVGSLKKYKTDIILRAHGHSFIAVEYANSLGIVLPGWKGLDDFALSRGSLGFAPDIGFVSFEIKKDSYSWNKHLFKLAEMQSVPHVIVEE
jgi:hypothetical protein